MEIVAPNEWHELARSLTSEKGTVLLLGSTDTGKSTLARYLAGTLLRSGITVTIVDADIGQSSLGLPGTVSLASFRSPEEMNRFRFQRFSFIGALSPAPVIPFLIKETCRFASQGRISTQITLIDTTGLVHDELGRYLKTSKIKAVRPDTIIAVERDDELEHILKRVDDVEIVRLQPPSVVRKRSRESRIRYREGKFADYFKNSGETLLHTHSVEFFFQSRPMSHGDLRIQPGALVGLSRDADTDGLGIVTEVDSDSITLKTPLRSMKGVRRVLFGNVTVACPSTD